jgi:hypothetical protein
MTATLARPESSAGRTAFAALAVRELRRFVVNPVFLLAVLFTAWTTWGNPSTSVTEIDAVNWYPAIALGGFGMTATFWLTRSIRLVWALANSTSRPEMAARSFTLCCMFLSAVLSNACPIRWVISPTSPAIRLACAVSCPISGRVAPGQASPPALSDSIKASRRLGSVGSGS